MGNEVAISFRANRALLAVKPITTKSETFCLPVADPLIGASATESIASVPLSSARYMLTDRGYAL